MQLQPASQQQQQRQASNAPAHVCVPGLPWPAVCLPTPSLQEGQPDRFCYGNQKALELFECT